LEVRLLLSINKSRVQIPTALSLLVFCLCFLHIQFASAVIAEPFPVRNPKEGTIGIRSTDFINNNYTTTSAKNNTMFGGRISSPVEDEEFGLGLDIEGQFVDNNPILNTFTAHEFYFKVFPEWQNSILYLGRKKQPWSELDSSWQLGAWEPVFKVDPLDMRVQGLTGFFVDIKKTDWALELFATPFFLPDHGPSIDARDGQFVQGHPWVSLPPKEVNIFGEQTPAYYTIDKPSATDVISNKGYALRFRWGKDDSHGDAAGFATQMSIGYLPINQLTLGFEGAYNTSEKSRLEIGINPEVIYHKLLGLDAVYRSENLRLGFAFLQEDSETPEFAHSWTYQSYQPTQFASPSLSYRWNNLETRVAYLKRFGGEAKTLGPQTALFKKAIPDRYGFYEQLKTELIWKQKTSNFFKYNTLARWVQELQERSDIISLQAGCQIGSFWQIYGGLDFLKTANLNSKSADLAETYQRNDRAYTGIQYVF
jgi:hypothetical protein